MNDLGAVAVVVLVGSLPLNSYVLSLGKITASNPLPPLSPLQATGGGSLATDATKRNPMLNQLKIPCEIPGDAQMSKSAAKLSLVTSKPPKPNPGMATPQNLSTDAKLWFEQTRDGFQIIDPAGLRTLEIAARALDEMARIQAVIKKSGDYYKDRNGVLRQHPAGRHFDQARRAYFAALKQLRLRTQ